MQLEIAFGIAVFWLVVILVLMWGELDPRGRFVAVSILVTLLAFMAMAYRDLSAGWM